MGRQLRPQERRVRGTAPADFFLSKMAKNDPFPFNFLTLRLISIVGLNLEALFMQKQTEIAVRGESRLRLEGRTLNYNY